MDWLTKQKTYVLVIILLVVVNITTLILLWTGFPGPPPMDKNGHPDTNNFLKNELGLDQQQQEKFNLLRQTLFDSMDSLNKQLWAKKLEIQEQAFKVNPDTQKVNRLLQEIAGYQIQNEKLMFYHFTGLRNILSAEQLVKFNKILNGPNKNAPRPGGKHNHNSPPPGEIPPPRR
ncbi:MAG: periplasmic heavy metal sensor [Ignavibacteriaceae bacterium]|nr:periplasmic heavy metal sensor [Ignavibacteriaceae bacterium]